ncbi:uncharacterized protein LOC132804333 [Ziziphus jujuba]|uniref:Uncharacterized protein LOC132804333 n=1 Tax=Ziziphus jujuba TaxID=326968 RepID=A0ABM4ACV4_ZIZJJ|nr:uncharacterized protein LOC132804333 [Ziziphus jujuba]
MAAPIAGRSTVVVRMLFRATTTNPTVSTSRLSSSSLSSVCSAFRPLQSQVSSPPSSRLVRRELAPLGLIHTAIASACLVSKLPADPTICIEGLSLSFYTCVQLLLLNTYCCAFSTPCSDILVIMKNYDYNPCLCDCTNSS